jgi:hypothetical protein
VGLTDSLSQIRSSALRENVATAFGGMHFFYFPSLFPSHCCVLMPVMVLNDCCLSFWSTGALYSESSEVMIADSVVSGNSARQQGGAAFMAMQSQVEVTTCMFEWNSAVIGGGAFFVSDAVCTFWGSQVGTS